MPPNDEPDALQTSDLKRFKQLEQKVDKLAGGFLPLNSTLKNLMIFTGL